MPKRLRPYQIEMLKYTMGVQHPALFVDMRLGKSIVTVRRIKMYKKCTEILIVCPYSAIQGWKDTLEDEGEVLAACIVGTGPQRRRAYALSKTYTDDSFVKGRRWYITNKEGFFGFKEIKDLLWHVTVLDESRFIANDNNAATTYYCNNFRHVDHRWVLTGTPAPESELEYYNQLRFLDPTILNYSSWYKFRNACFTQPIDCCGQHDPWYIRSKGKKFLTEKLAEHTYHLMRTDVDMGGEKIYQVRNLHMPKRMRKIYKTAEEEFILEYDDKCEKTVWAMTKFLWLRRICGGILDGQPMWPGKMELLLKMLGSEFYGEQMIIWCQFIDELKYVKTILDVNGYDSEKVHGDVKPKERDEIGKRFLKKDFQILVAQPECYKFGKDLSSASVMVYYSSPLGLETRSQTEDRIIDVANKNSVLILDLIVEDSIDEDIYKAVKKKARRNVLMANLIKSARKHINVKKHLRLAPEKTYSGVAMFDAEDFDNDTTKQSTDS